jgi:hypothetical protein
MQTNTENEVIDGLNEVMYERFVEWELIEKKIVGVNPEEE